MKARLQSRSMRSRVWAAVTLFMTASLLLNACNFSISQPTVDPNAVSTLVYATAEARLTQDAFQTVVAQLTQASQATETPEGQAQATATQTSPTQGASATATTAPSATPVPPTQTAVPPTATAVPPSATPKPKPVDWVQFIADVSIPDGTSFTPAATFTKTWRLKNIGSTTWTKDYALVYSGGESMGAKKVINLTASVAPGAQVDLSADMVAPANLGNYEGDWMLRNAAGNLFGIGPNAANPFWVKVTVIKAATLVYDFTSNYCATGVAWGNGANTNPLPCPGTVGSLDGDVSKVDKPALETGAIDNEAALRVEPQRVDNGVIKGTYPAITIQSGYHLQTVIGCWADATACDIIFSIHYKIGSGPETSLVSYEEKFDHQFRKIDVDLSQFAGKDVVFIFKVAAKGAANAQNSGHWLYPRIVK
jgi:hypothetical protein